MRLILITLIFISSSVYAATTCEVSGCSGELCTVKGEEVFSICFWKAEFDCYRQMGICEADQNGVCGWRQTPELIQCISKEQNNVLNADPFTD